MKLIVISSANVVSDEPQLINGLFAAGLQYFHLRKPDATRSSVLDLLKSIKTEYYCNIALHQFHEIAEDFNIKRLHFTEDHRRKVDLHTVHGYLNEGYTLSSSIHHLPDLEKLTGHEYTFFGPVFNSLSKPQHLGVVADDFRLITNVETEVIALGGVTAEHLGRIKAMNFDGAAVLGAIWNHPEKSLESFNHLMNQLPDKYENR